MFLKATTPTIRDTVIVRDAAGNEITRFTAIWKRPDTQTRKALLRERMENLEALAKAQAALQENPSGFASDVFTETLEQIEVDNKTAIREHLHSIADLLDADDAPVEYSPAVLEEMLRWGEYTTPLAESLARLIDGKAVEAAAAKNAAPPVLSGQVSPA